MPGLTCCGKYCFIPLSPVSTAAGGESCLSSNCRENRLWISCLAYVQCVVTRDLEQTNKMGCDDACGVWSSHLNMTMCWGFSDLWLLHNLSLYHVYGMGDGVSLCDYGLHQVTLYFVNGGMMFRSNSWHVTSVDLYWGSHWWYNGLWLLEILGFVSSLWFFPDLTMTWSV